jgi:hypothetical protein
MIWNNCKADHLFYDQGAAIDVSCNVELNGDKIRVWYESGNGTTLVYEGKEIGVGHFELHAPSVNGRATLHMFNGSKVLEGFWVENGYRGMWRIILA